jgi:hypothetical protein
MCRDHPPVDLRADFDPRPIASLAEIHRATLDPDSQAFLAHLPTPPTYASVTSDVILPSHRLSIKIRC